MADLNFELVYWHWLVLGFVLMAMELVVPSFTLLWFGAAAIVTGSVLFFVPISLTTQIVLWTVSSSLLTFLWFKYLKPLSIDKTKAGMPDTSILGETGQVIKLPHDSERGVVRFSVPKLGEDEWPIIIDADSKANLNLGDRVRVISVEGNALLVTKA